jgi:chromosome partitioning protein
MTVVAVLNYKGGVGKTTMTANLGAEIANRGGKVLLIDLDPQASLTFSFYRPDEWDPDRTILRWYESYIMSGTAKNLEDLVLTPPRVNGVLERGRLDLISSDLRLVDVELDLAHGLGGARYQTFNPQYLRVYRLLADALAGKAFQDYDVILMDCAPNFNMVTRTAVVASEHILVPAKADYLSTLGIDYLRTRLSQLVDEYDRVAGSNPAVAINPVILGVVFTMVQYAGAGLMVKLQGYINGLKDIEVPVFRNSLRESKAVFADPGEHGIPAVLSRQTTENVEYDLHQITSEFLARIRV